MYLGLGQIYSRYQKQCVLLTLGRGREKAVSYATAPVFEIPNSINIVMSKDLMYSFQNVYLSVLLFHIGSAD